MYRLSGVTKEYNHGAVLALRGVTLEVPDGGWLAVRGPTGHGKSTLLQLMGGLDRPTGGTVELEGSDLGRLSETAVTRLRARLIGFVFQAFNLIPTLSAAENVETAVAPLGVRGAERRRRAAEALAAVGLEDRVHHLPSELSGGQQQRVAIARALVKQPAVLLADEPTGNLDEETASQVLRVLLAASKSRGTTLIIVTHDAWLAHNADRILELHEGKLVTARAPVRRTGFS